MSGHKLVIKDALWQLAGRVISALFGFVITKIIASYLWPLRYGDYGTIFRFFAWWTALVDFWIYVLAIKQLWTLKKQIHWDKEIESDLNPTSPLAQDYWKFVGTRVFLIGIVYSLAIAIAYLIPAYTENPYIIRGLPLAMCYSASNMYAGIQQIPLQLFRKMKRLTWSLIIARLSQLLVLLPVVYLFFTNVDFQSAQTPNLVLISAFCLVIFSVVASSLGQNVEMHLRTKDILPLKIRFDFSFIKKILSQNWRFGFSYFFSSFHTLLVLIFLGWFFPTAQNFDHAGKRALALSLIEILLIIPSSLGNSLLHKIPNYSKTQKQKSLWNLMTMVVRIGALIALNFWIFADDIILLVSSSKFLWSRTNTIDRWANQVLPFLGIVLVLSFIKQVYNYVFVAMEQQNRLFLINLIGVVLGAVVGIYLIPSYGLLGWVLTQLLIEGLFTGGAIRVAARNHLTPHFDTKKVIILISLLVLVGLLGTGLHYQTGGTSLWFWKFFLIAALINIPVLLLAIKPMKTVAKGLTQE